MCYNPDTGIKGPHFSLKLWNSAPYKLRTFKVPLPRAQKVKNIRLSRRRTPPISGQNSFPRWCPLIRDSTVVHSKRRKINIGYTLDMSKHLVLL